MRTHPWKRQEKITVLLHVFAWVSFLSLPILFIKNRGVEVFDLFKHWQFWFFGLCFIVPYYLNSLLWTPYVIRKKKYVLYVISIVLIGFVFAFWLRPFDKLMQMGNIPGKESPFHKERPFPPPMRDGEVRPFPMPHPPGKMPPPSQKGIKRLDISSVYIVLLVIILGSLLRMVQYWIQSQQKVQQIQHEWTKAELAFLKAQVHPHFLFNTLNNIYSLALTSDPSTATSIYKLSQLMRYYMDERNEEEVDLKEEVQAIQDFIGLQKLRVGPNCTLTERYEGLDIPKKIYPFILFPFVENAFKYGLRASEFCYLDFCIQVHDDRCVMSVKNSVLVEPTMQPSSGIGLKNTRKLLEHLYPNKFELDIVQGEGEFFVKLLLYI